MNGLVASGKNICIMKNTLFVDEVFHGDDENVDDDDMLMNKRNEIFPL